MITSLSVLLLEDVFYKRDNKNKYILNVKNEFITDDVDGILDRIKENVTEAWKQVARRKNFLKQCRILIDYSALKQVLMKYTRDVFGQKRLLSVLSKVSNYKANPSYMEVFGMKINSANPYIYRRAGCFLYWCCVLKPFHIITTKDNITVSEDDQYIMECFNEITAYSLIKIMLNSCAILKYCNFECENKNKYLKDDDCTLTININEDREFFKNFLYDIHFRSLSRSSFELFMSKFCIIPHCKKGICPLTNPALIKGNLNFIDEFDEKSP